MSKREQENESDEDSNDEDTLLQSLAKDVVNANISILDDMEDVESDDDDDDANYDAGESYKRFAAQTKKKQVNSYLRNQLSKRLKTSYLQHVGWNTDDDLTAIDSDVDELMEEDESINNEDALKQVLKTKASVLDRAITDAVEDIRDEVKNEETE